MWDRMRPGRRSFVLALSLALTVGAWEMLLAAEEKSGDKSQTADKPQGGLRVDDLPKPVPGLIRSIREIGNTVGEGISKAAGEGARAVKKAVTENKETRRGTEKK